jgi:tetratricopeptide (TPR) repeat protein
MRFCPNCGAPLMAGAKFCVECGRALDAAAPPAGESARGRRGAPGGRNTITNAFVFVFVAITLVGLAAAAWIMLKTPDVVRQQIAVAPPAGVPSADALASNQGVAAPNQAAPDQNAAANPAAAGGQGGGLPAGHPRIELPTEARTFVDKIERDAHAKPDDVVAWDKLGAVSMRAAMFDQTYYGKAQEAYAHALKLEPDNLDALRGIGDIDYDQQHYDEAVAAYEHYLKKKPNDPEVRTDLGTMYLYMGNADQAVVQYKKAIAAKPGFFQAYYNMGIAYAQENKADDAAATLKQAMALAPDDAARDQVKDLIAKLSGAPAASPSMQAAAASTPATAQISHTPAAVVAAKSTAAAPAAVVAKSTAAAAPAASAAIVAKVSASPAAAQPPGASDEFHGAVEEMVRGLPIAGPKVGSVQWPDKLKARVMMDNFPMEQMPPFAKTKFLSDLKAGIDSAKKDNNISSPVEVNIVDGASGRVMETITQ